MQLNDTLAFFAKVIEGELGIIYAEDNYYQLQNRLEDIARLLGDDGIPTLHARAQKGITGSFRQLLLDLATNNETSFFRDPRVFNALAEVVLPELKPVAGKVRIWSAASSTGQEALTLSMVIEELLAKKPIATRFEILGTDISERVLERARKRVYTQLEVQRGVPAPLLLKYFTRAANDQWCPVPRIAERTTFAKLNLKDTFHFPEKFQLILCRNVLIYQNMESKIEILRRLTAQLAEDGYLVLGSGESLLGISADYEARNIGGALVYRKRPPALKMVG